jgi:PiT family inorganic phosphate transporter
MDLVLVVALIGAALLFTFRNGFHDAAHAISTAVSTRALTPGQAVVWAAIWNFVAAFVVGTAVAATVGWGLVDIGVVTPAVVFSGLFGAVAWDLLTRLLGVPTSSSHALIGAYAGAAVAKAGWSALIAPGWNTTLAFIVLSPVIGLGVGFALMVAIYWLFRRVAPGRVDRGFRRLQLLSAALLSLNHGSNDAQKTAGVIVALLFSVPAYRAMVTGTPGGLLIPLWVVVLAHAAFALGTLSGGWRIISTAGTRLTKLQPAHGFAAETGAAGAVCLATTLGIPVSTTHAITGAIVGVGATRRLSAVRWGVASRIVWAWVLTIPAAGMLGMAVQGLVGLFGIR